jgi:hypothetical protein
MALGKFNRLLANSNSQENSLSSLRDEEKLPGALVSLWKGREAMRTPSGEVMGPAEVFLAFTGELDLQLGEVREIPLEREAAVSKGLGKYVRMVLAKAGVDFVVEDQQRLLKAASSFKGLLTGKEVRGEVLVAELPQIAAEINVSEDDLWDEVMEIVNAG